jgi:hypothetical protein
VLAVNGLVTGLLVADQESTGQLRRRDAMANGSGALHTKQRSVCRESVRVSDAIENELQCAVKLPNGCDAVWTCRYIPKFQWNILPRSSTPYASVYVSVCQTHFQSPYKNHQTRPYVFPQRGSFNSSLCIAQIASPWCFAHKAGSSYLRLPTPLKSSPLRFANSWASTISG